MLFLFDCETGSPNSLKNTGVVPRNVAASTIQATPGTPRRSAIFGWETRCPFNRHLPCRIFDTDYAPLQRRRQRCDDQSRVAPAPRLRRTILSISQRPSRMC